MYDQCLDMIKICFFLNFLPKSHNHVAIKQLSSTQYRIFVKLSIMFFNMHQPSAYNLRALLAHERRFIPYDLRHHCKLARTRYVNSHSDLQFDAAFVEWCNVTGILNFQAPFKKFLSYIYSFY